MYKWIGIWTGSRRLMDGMARWTKWIPRPVMALICRIIGILIYASATAMRKQVKSNMNDLLRPQSAKQLNRLVRLHFVNIAFSLFEILVDSFRLTTEGQKLIRAEGEQYIREALLEKKGVIVFAPHCGNFFYYYWYLCQQFDALTVATAGSRELKPLYERFRSLGCDGLDYDSTPPLQMMRILRSHLHNNGIIFLMGDFWRSTFPVVRWFGRTTKLPGGAAALALDLHTPIVMLAGRRVNNFQHLLTFSEPIRLADQFHKSERSGASELLNRELEQAIIQQPEQWLYWFNVQERWEGEE